MIESGWIEAGFTDRIRMGSRGHPSIDPFVDIDPLLVESSPSKNIDILASVYNLTIDEVVDMSGIMEREKLLIC